MAAALLSKTAAGKRHPGFYLALIAACFAGVVVVLGSFTRLVDAGLGCPDWPTCYGHLWVPNEAHEIAAANENFAETPVETHKTWPEQIHRIFAGTLGLLIAALAISAVYHRERRSYPFRLPLFLLVLVIWQAIFGMWTVTLKLWPQVVTLHLMGGVSTLTLLWLLTLRLSNTDWTVPATVAEKFAAARPWLVVALVLVFLQVMLGGWLSSNYAAVACGVEFPTCMGSWWPEMDIPHGMNIVQDIGPNYLGGQLDHGGRVAIHMFHRVGAVLVAFYLIALSLRLWRTGSAQLKPYVIALLAVLCGQVALGISNVIFAVPLAVAVAHNFGGALLLIVLALTGGRIWSAQREAEEA